MDQSRLARSLAPEEVRAGMIVAVLHEIVEWPSWFWDSDAALLPADQPVRIARVPNPAGTPLRIKSLCLPFVLVEAPCGERKAIDVRTSKLALLSGRYASQSRKAFRRAARKSKGCTST